MQTLLKPFFQNGLAPAVLALLAFGGTARAGTYDFDNVTAAGLFADTAPGGPAGPLVQYSDISFNFGVILNDSRFGDEATSGSNLYATSDFYTLADGSSLPGLVEGDLSAPYSRIDLDVINGNFAGDFTLSAFDASSTLLGRSTVSLSDFAGAETVGHLSLSGLSSLSYFTVSSNQKVGQIDFAIDTVRLSNTAPVPETSTVASFGLLLAPGLSGAASAARKKKASPLS